MNPGEPMIRRAATSIGDFLAAVVLGFLVWWSTSMVREIASVLGVAMATGVAVGVGLLAYTAIAAHFAPAVIGCGTP